MAQRDERRLPLATTSGAPVGDNQDSLTAGDRGNGIDYPAFYAYAYPAPKGYRAASEQPEAAFWHADLSEFVLPYEAVQSATDPDEALMAFLVSTYEAAAELGGWDREILECAQGTPRQVRRPDAASVTDAPSVGGEKVEREDGPSKGRYRHRPGGRDWPLARGTLARWRQAPGRGRWLM